MAISTSCRDCVFAEWLGKTQIGCDFDRIDKFDERGVVIEGHEDQDGKQYFLIKDRICNTCRDADAVKDIPARRRKPEVRKQVVPTICVAIYVDSEDQFGAARESITSVLDQVVPAKEIILIYNVDQANAPVEYGLWLSEAAERSSLLWRVQSIIKPGVDYGGAVDLTLSDKDIRGLFFSSARAGYLYPPDFIDRIDRAINDELLRFVALLPDDDGNRLLVQIGLHRLLGGNRPAAGAATIIDKLNMVAADEGTAHMIKRWEDIRG